MAKILAIDGQLIDSIRNRRHRCRWRYMQVAISTWGYWLLLFSVHSYHRAIEGRTMAVSAHVGGASLCHHTRQVSVVRKTQGQPHTFGTPSLAIHTSERPLKVSIVKSTPETNDGGVNSDGIEESTLESAATSPGLAKGQGTAIVTGAISILFGIAYLALVQVMDMRGAELQPPPPEAFLN